MSYKIVRQIILAGLVTTQTLLILQLAARTHKAEVCNAVFIRYWYNRNGTVINLDALYRDGKKWVYDKRYNEEHVHAH